MTSREAFKVGFLARCADEGLSTDEAHVRVRDGLEKSAFAGVTVDPVNAVKTVAPWLALAAIGTPIVGGMVGGHLAAKATDDDSNINEAKTNETLAEYQRLTDQARRQAALRRIRGLPTLGGLRGVS